MSAVSSPTRVDLAGGTLDCWPLYVFAGDAQTTNLSISVFTHVDLKPKADKQVEVFIEDLKYTKTFKNAQSLIECVDPELDLVRAQVRYWKPESGFSLRTRSESPIGGGLGGSSSLCISLIKAFSSLTGRKLSTLEKVTLAHNLEAQVLKKPTGTQDYFPAIEPGLNIIHYTAEGPKLERLKFPVDYFASRMILVYTGQPHHSGLNNWQVIKAVIDGHKPTLVALQEIKKIGDQMASACRDQDWQRLAPLFRDEFAARVQLSAGFSSPRIEELEKIALGAGAEAVKICGAGGGGCVMLWSQPERKSGVIQACREKGFQVLDARPVVE
ncbi:MAG: galactokinase [Bdellovibrionales bacterium]